MIFVLEKIIPEIVLAEVLEPKSYSVASSLFWAAPFLDLRGIIVNFRQSGTTDSSVRQFQSVHRPYLLKFLA
ncbi:hypothetical protein [Pareuzebyella sediminis]|uniref:hypothetical protein n=1 Tax=Pareuzebyella sediminis TaxID=2607998 RepID=UPI0011EEB450|nr:hypothetical protein [Pareuzebyella sediminis]